MRHITNLFLLVAVVSLALNGCGPSLSPTATAMVPTPSVLPPTLTTVPMPPTPIPTPKGKTIIVTSAEDGGTGTLRQALQVAAPGDIITFDPTVFPPKNPATIAITSLLPEISQGYLTIDASNAGVILDGEKIKTDWGSAFKITSTGNTIRGVQIINFSPGAGFEISSGAQQNLIGGDPGLGSGPTGQGNLVGNSSDGASMGGEQTAFNRITGNYFGINPAGEALTLNTGIHIEDGANHNTIGPGNVVSNCSDAGIEIFDASTNDNTITENSIFGNSGDGINTKGIGSRPGGNLQLTAPTIADFDLQADSIQGTSCPGCKVEIFSDQNDEGKIYEGSSIADQGGAFSFTKGTPFASPHLTATATDHEGNTSGFSAFTWGATKFPEIQNGNKLSKAALVTKTSAELLDNHMGGDIGNWDWQKGIDNTSLYLALQQRIYDLGLKWVRTNFWSPNPLNWQEVLRQPGVYEIPQDVDDFVTDLSTHDVNIVLTLSAGAGLDGQAYGPNCWGEPGWGVLGSREPQRWFSTQADRDRFVEYARFMVQHFKGRVEYYEIWNEASSGEYPGDCRGDVSLNDYAILIKQVAPIIRQIDPQAKIVVGVNGRFEYRERQWMLQMLGLGLASQVDEMSWHPFYGESPLEDTGKDPQHTEPFYWRDYPVNFQSFEKQAASLGFRGGFMVEEMVWRTPNDVTAELPLYSDIVAAKYAARATILHLGMNFTMVSNQMLMPSEIKLLPKYYLIRNICTVMAGAQPTTINFDLQGDKTNIKDYTFLLPNGDKMIAIWKDNVAVDDDPGISATLTIPGYSGWNATGIDVLTGFQQLLVTSDVNGDLVIDGFLLKDYPIIFRLSK